MKVVAVYPGRFHPFHKGHAASFKQLAQKFGLDNTFLAISAKQEQPKSPFSAQDRAKMATSLGIPSKNIIAVRNPYAAQEYIDQLNLDPEKTALVFGVSKKDMEGDPALGIPPDPRFSFKAKKDGSPAYLQPFNKAKIDPMSQHGYVMSTDVAEFPIAGKSMRDASAIRKAYAGADDKTKMRILKDLYGDAAESMKQVFDNNLQITESIKALINMIKPMLSEATVHQKAKFVKLLSEAKTAMLNEAIGNAADYSYDMTDVDDRITTDQLNKHISSKMLSVLKPREEYIVRARFGFGGADEKSISELAQTFGIGTQRIRQIEYSAMNKLRRAADPKWKSRPEITQKYAEADAAWEKYKKLADHAYSFVEPYGGHFRAPDEAKQKYSEASKIAQPYYKAWRKIIGQIYNIGASNVNEAAGDVYSKGQAAIVDDLGNGYFLGDDSYDDDEGFTKEGYSVYYQEGPDQYRHVGHVQMSPYRNAPGTIEREIERLINQDQGINEEKSGVEQAYHDSEVRPILAYARQHYPEEPDLQAAFVKFVLRSLQHSKDDDERQDIEIDYVQGKLKSVDQELDNLSKQLSDKHKVSESQDYLDEK